MIFLSALILICSCQKTGEEGSNAALAAGNALSPVLLAQAEYARNRAVILMRGNDWVSGIPGFGVNAFSALAGSYRLLEAGQGSNSQVSGEAEAGGFSVFVTGELLFFSGEWQQAAAGAIPAYQQNGEEGFVEAVILEDHKGIFRTAVFQFPGGLDSSGLNAASLSQMVSAWANKFLYFISQADAATEFSLPAVVEF